MANQLEEKITVAQEHYRWLLGRELTRAERMHLRKSISEMFGVTLDIDEDGRMLSENDNNSEVITMSEETNKKTSNEDVEAVAFEEYENLLGRSLTDAEREFLTELKAAKDEEQKEMSEPQIIRELDRTAKTRKDSDKRAVSSLTGLASGRTRGETNKGGN